MQDHGKGISKYLPKHLQRRHLLFFRNLGVGVGEDLSIHGEIMEASQLPPHFDKFVIVEFKYFVNQLIITKIIK